jgi:hypothetical protein
MENNFYSIDRLIEFGMGMSIAQQMVQTMNTAMSNMHIAGTHNNFIQSNPSTYFVVLNEQQIGPLSENEIKQLIQQKKINSETYVWHNGLTDWEKASNVPEIIKFVALSPPPFNK